MSDNFNRSVYLFHRDLRLEDNTSLINALKNSKMVFPCFIFDPNLMKGTPRNDHAIQFMIESLQHLDKKLHEVQSSISFYYGEIESVLERIIKENEIDAIFSNLDYSRYAKKRDKRILSVANEKNIKFKQYPDYLLSTPMSIYTNSGTRYSVFTYFYKKASQKQVKPVQSTPHSNYATTNLQGSINSLLSEMMREPNPDLFVKGGRPNGLELLSEIVNLQYSEDRDYPSKTGTSLLSAHLKFGTISIREIYHHIKNVFGENHPLIRQLYWRDFYVYLAIHYPQR